MSDGVPHADRHGDRVRAPWRPVARHRGLPVRSWTTRSGRRSNTTAPTFPARCSRTSIAICPAPRRAPTGGIRCRTLRRSPTPCRAWASTPACRSSPTIRIRPCTPAVSGGWCDGSGTTASRSSTAGSPSGSRKAGPRPRGGNTGHAAASSPRPIRARWRVTEEIARDSRRRRRLAFWTLGPPSASAATSETIDRVGGHIPGATQLLLQEQRGRARRVSPAGRPPPPARSGPRRHLRRSGRLLLRVRSHRMPEPAGPRARRDVRQPAVCWIVE